MPLGRAPPPPAVVVVAEEGEGEIGLLPAGLGMGKRITKPSVIWIDT